MRLQSAPPGQNTARGRSRIPILLMEEWFIAMHGMPLRLMLVAAIVALILCAQPVLAQVGSTTSEPSEYRLKLIANPTQVAADNSTEARIRIEVRDANGQLTADDVQVVVSTNLGEVSSDHVSRQKSIQVRASGGIAIMYATSDTEGLATVTAWVREARNSTTVRFLPEGEAAKPVSKVVHVKGEWVGFSVDYRVIQARDNAEVRLGNLTITADGIADVDMNTHIVRASSLTPGGVKVVVGDVELAGADLYFDMNQRRGLIRAIGDDGIRRIVFDGFDLAPLSSEFEVPADAFNVECRESVTWLIARSISYFMGEKLVVRHGSAWINQKKVLSFPKYWILGLPGYAGSTNSNMFSLNTDGGVALEFPFFYNVTETTTSAIKIEHGTDASYIAARDGWSLAWEREYRSLTDNYEGSFEIDGLPRSNWGLNWRDQRMLDAETSSYMSVSSPEHQSLYADMSLYRYTDDGRFNVRGYFDNPQDYERSYGLIGDWLSSAHKFDSRKTYRVGLTLSGERHFRTGAVEFANNMYGELDFGTHNIDKNMSLRPLLRNNYSWDTSGYSSNAVRADLDFTRKFGQKTTVGLNYSAEYFTGDANIDGLEEILSLDMSASRKQWYLYLYGSHNLTREDAFGYLNLNYYQGQKWRYGISSTYYDFSESDVFNEWEFAVARIFDQREIGLSYSEETGRISLELGGFTSF